MKKIHVLGMGNKLMMDDGIGAYVVETLSIRNAHINISYIVGETDVCFCLKQIEEASFLIILDAACLNKTPGTISIIPLEQIFGHPIHSLSLHDLNLINEISMRGTSVEGLFIGIEPHEINYCYGLSGFLQEQYLDIVEKIEEAIIQNLTKNT